MDSFAQQILLSIYWVLAVTVGFLVAQPHALTMLGLRVVWEARTMHLLLQTSWPHTGDKEMKVRCDGTPLVI